MSIDLTLSTPSHLHLSSLLDKYINPHSQFQQLAISYTTNAIHKIQQSLNNGSFLIADPVERSKSMRNKMYRKSMVENQQEEEEERSKSIRKVDEKEQKRLLRRLMKEQVQIEERREKNLQQMRKREEIQDEKNQQERLSRMKSMIDQKRRFLQQKSKQRCQNQLKRQQQIKLSNQRLSRIKQQKQLFEVFEENYQNQVLFPTLEEKKQKLKERRELNKPMSISELRVFEKEYLMRRGEMEVEILEKRNSLALPKYSPPKKSINLLNILQNQLHLAHIQQQQKQKILSSNIQRSSQYSNLVKHNFKPKISQRSATPLVQNITISREHRDEKLLGNDYLSYSKLKIKRNGSVSLLKSNTSSMNELETKSKISKFSNYLETKGEGEYYDEIRKKKMKRIMGDKEMTKYQKIEELGKEAERLDEMIERRNLLNRVKKEERKEMKGDTTEALLASVRAKVGMLEIIQS